MGGVVEEGCQGGGEGEGMREKGGTDQLDPSQ